MKLFLLASLLFICQSGFSQDISLHTFSGKPADSSTCVLEIANLVSVSPIDSLNNEVKKPNILKLIDYLDACKFKFVFDRNFKDKAFQLVVPRYLWHVSYELGNQDFAITLSDSTGDCTIAFYYDLDDHYKKYFFSNANEEFKKAKTIELNGQKIYMFKNWDDRNGGTFFSSNHMMISYFTKSRILEPELQNAISKFKW